MCAATQMALEVLGGLPGAAQHMPLFLRLSRDAIALSYDEQRAWLVASTVCAQAGAEGLFAGDAALEGYVAD